VGQSFRSRSFGGALKAARRLLDGTNWYLPAPGSTPWEWIPTLGAAGAVALAYFLAARLELASLSPGSDMAVFRPAAGIAAGFLIATGRASVQLW
jgi:hypothetical protein